MALADTLLGSTENFAFSAPIPPSDCAERLSREVRTDLRFWDKRPLTGDVSPVGFSVRLWRNNKLPGDVRARGQFIAEPGGTRVEVRLGINRLEFLMLPIAVVFGALLAEVAVHQLWFALLFAVMSVAIYIRSRAVERGDRQKLASLIREALSIRSRD